MKILAIGAHPDDCEIHAGGILNKYKLNAYTLILSQTTECRKKESRIAANLIEMNIPVFAHISKQDMSDQRKIISVIESIINVVKPAVVLTHHYADSHQDHRAAYNAALSACRAKQISILLYDPTYSGGITAGTFRPQWFTVLNRQQVDAKLRAIECHKSQNPSRWTDRAEAASIYWGPKASSTYAEVFEIVKIVQPNNTEKLGFIEV